MKTLARRSGRVSDEVQGWIRDGPLTDLLILGDCGPGESMTGGSAATTAVAAARLGLRVALVAAVGDDPAGHVLLSELAREGVNISGVAIRDSSPADLALTAADVPGSLLGGARHVHVSAFVRLQRSLGPGLTAMLKAARAAGTTTSLSCCAEPGSGDAAQLNRVLSQCDVLLATPAEALAISGTGSQDAAMRALAAGDRSITVRLGAGDAMCRSDSGQHLALPSARAASPGGAASPDGDGRASDCFDAGLLAGLLRGMALPDAMALGCAVAAAATGDGGFERFPDLPAALELARKVRLRRQE
jgi:sugar/nucleoside kinase (ribokinase family)